MGFYYLVIFVVLLLVGLINVGTALVLATAAKRADALRDKCLDQQPFATNLEDPSKSLVQQKTTLKKREVSRPKEIISVDELADFVVVKSRNKDTEIATPV
jgi:hypothetical protein